MVQLQPLAAVSPRWPLGFKTHTSARMITDSITQRIVNRSNWLSNKAPGITKNNHVPPEPSNKSSQAEQWARETPYDAPEGPLLHERKRQGWQKRPISQHPSNQPLQAPAPPPHSTLWHALCPSTSSPLTAQAVAILVTAHASEMKSAGDLPQLDTEETQLVFDAVWNSWRPLQAVLKAIPSSITTPALNQALILAPGWADVLDLLLLALHTPVLASQAIPGPAAPKLSTPPDLTTLPTPHESVKPSKSAARIPAVDQARLLPPHHTTHLPDRANFTFRPAPSTATSQPALSYASVPLTAVGSPSVGVIDAACLRLIIRRAPSLSSLHATMMLVSHIMDVHCFAAAVERLRELSNPLLVASVHQTSPHPRSPDLAPPWQQRHGGCRQSRHLAHQ